MEPGLTAESPRRGPGPWALGPGPDARVILVAAAAMVGTLPGRTQGLGLITEPLLADLRLDRVELRELNFWATILGSAGALGIGRLIDRFGSRVMLTSVAVALGLVVCGDEPGRRLRRARHLDHAHARPRAERALGRQPDDRRPVVRAAHRPRDGRLQRRHEHRLHAGVSGRGRARAVPGLARRLACGRSRRARARRAGWRGCCRRGPEPPVFRPAGDGAAAHGRPVEDRPAPRGRRARARRAFWMFAIGTALYGLVASGIGLFNESILAERGFGADVYYQTLVVTALTALAGNFLGGWLAQRVTARRRCWRRRSRRSPPAWSRCRTSRRCTHVMRGPSAMGLGGGLVMVLFFSVWPRVFGRRHLGRIQGAAQALTVFASALGPLLLAWCVDWTGSYAAMFRILAAVIAATALSALAVRLR